MKLTDDQPDVGENERPDKPTSFMKPTSGGNKNGRWEIVFNPQPKNINPVPDPDWPLRTGSRQTSAEGASHPASEPTAGVRMTRSASLKDSQSSVNQPLKGQKQRQAKKRDGDDSQVSQPLQRNRGGSVPSEATSGRRGAGSGTRKFTPTESKISEEVLSEDIPPPQETAKPKKGKDQTGRTNRDSQQQPKSTKHTTTKSQNPSNPDSKASLKQPSPPVPRPEPSSGNPIPQIEENDSSAQDSSTQRAITTNPNPNPNRPTSDKDTSDTHKMPPPPNSYKIFPRTPAKPTDQQGQVPQNPQPQSKKRSRNESEPEEGTSALNSI